MRVEVEVILATTHRVEAYGGIRVAPEALEQMASQVRSNTGAMVFEHDWTRPFDATTKSATVRLRDDGEYELVAVLDVDADQWNDWAAQLEATGAPGGWSFATPERIGQWGDGDGDGAPVALAADAHHFSDEAIIEATREFVPSGASVIAVDRYYQFAAEPPAVVILSLLAQFALAVPPSLLANYIFAAFSRVQRERTAPSTFRTVLEDEVEEDGRTRRRRATFELTTSDRKALRTGIEKMTEKIGEEGAFGFDGEEWGST